MSKKFDGYKEARLFEGATSGLLKSNPPNKRNAKEWLAFCRTLVTGLQLIEDVAVASLKEKT